MGSNVPLVTLHSTGNNWRTFEFEDCGNITTIADRLCESLQVEFHAGTVTELYVCKPYIAIKFSRLIPSCWSVRVLDIIRDHVKIQHRERKDVLLRIAD